MSDYRTFTTTMGRRYKVRMTEDEKSERSLYWIVVSLLTFSSTVLMTAIWLTR